MKIGIYDPYLDDLGGGEKYMMSIALSLSQSHDVDVFWNNPQDFSSLSQRFGIDFTHINRVPNIFTPQVSALKRFLETKEYDNIIFLSDGSIPLLGAKKLFLHIQQPLKNSQTNSLWGKIKLSRVTQVFCNSYFTKSFVDPMLGVHAKVIYPAVTLYPKKVKKENTILHVGRFRLIDPLTHVGDYKKQHVMISSFKNMVDNGLNNWELVMAVSVQEKDRDAFKDMQKEAKGYPIIFSVNKSNQELWDLYSKAKIYWHASGYGEDLKMHPEYAEHFGISTVEAMGAGCVPVVINAGGQKEIVSDNVNGFTWDSLDELETKTQLLIKNKDLLEKLSKQAVQRAQDFSSESFSNSVKHLLE